MSFLPQSLSVRAGKSTLWVQVPKMGFRKGSMVWLEDKDSVWVEAEVVDLRDKNAMEWGKRKLLPRDPDADHGGLHGVAGGQGLGLGGTVEAEVVDLRDKNAMEWGKDHNFVGKLLPRDPDANHGGVDDMTKLTHLNEPGVLYNLRPPIGS